MTIATQIPHPPIVNDQEWLVARKEHLLHEKELTKAQDRLSAARRRLPMVLVEKNYVFDGPNGPVSLADIFEGQTQLIIYHFMFDPEWDKGCGGCTGYVNALGDLSSLKECNTSFALVSRAPFEKLEAYKQKMGWNRPWYSSFGNTFNYDFHVTLDEAIAEPEYNYKSKEELVREHGPEMIRGEHHGLSVFFRLEDQVYHTYSTYGRGVEHLTDTYALLEVTPYGRQEDWEDSPEGWPQRPTYG